VRRALAAVLAAAALVAGCGSPPPDLFAVDRSGTGANADLRMIVNDGGSVSCDGKSHPLDADRLLTARRLERDLEPQAELSIKLPPGPGSVLSYRVSMEKGTVAFADTSSEIPSTFQRVEAFTKDVAERVCGIQH
jgi:hypothetical protein